MDLVVSTFWSLLRNTTNTSVLQTEFHASQREQEVRQWQQREAFRVELDATLADKQALEQRRGEQEKAEEEEMKVFGTAKKVIRDALLEAISSFYHHLSLSQAEDDFPT